MKALACIGMGKSEAAIVDGFRMAGLEMEETAVADLTEKKIKESDYLFVFSANYSPAVSAVCQKALVPYLSYVIEMPAKELYDETVKNPCNYIFCFDVAMCTELEQRIPGRCFHLPLGAAEVDVSECKEEEPVDVSFVGSLCQEHGGDDWIEGLSDFTRGYLESLWKTQVRIYGYGLLKAAMKQEVFDELEKQLSPELWSGVEAGFESHVLADVVLAGKVTEMERKQLLKAVSEQFETHLYMTEDDGTVSELPAVHVHREAVPSGKKKDIYRNSRINLCFAHRSIVSGVPQEVYEIMAAGGFVLTNFQQEITENFIVGEHLDTFASESELLEKIAYYLEHEEERVRMAEAGHQAVREYHSYVSRVVAMFNTVFSEEGK